MVDRRIRSGRRGTREGRGTLGVLLCTLAVLCPLRSVLAEESARTRVLRHLEEGRPSSALAICDSLLALDLSDLTAGYLSARAEEKLGRDGRARCRYLELEGIAPGGRVAFLSMVRRWDLERRLADRQFALGPAIIENEDARTPPQVALFPLEPLGGETVSPYFGLLWTYLLFDAWRGAGSCPAPIPSTLLVQEMLMGRRAVRVAPEFSRRPINTVGGLRARLAAVPNRDGRPYLEESEGIWDASVRAALEQFQADQGLPVTADADLTTLGALDRELERWLERTPVPLPPNLVPRAMELLGATRAVRGTYRREGPRIVVQVSLVGPDGQATDEPTVLSFPVEETTRFAFDAARRLAASIGTELGPAARPAEPLGELSLETAARSLVVLDRGLSRITESRWRALSSQVQLWKPVAEAHAYEQLSVSARADLEAALLDSWSGSSPLDPARGMDSLWGDFGSGGAPGLAGPGVYSVLGNIGTIRVRGSQ